MTALRERIHFYDAATPENVPSGVHAGVYANGFAWSRAQILRMAAVFYISVERAASWARFARCIDIENFAGQPPDAVPFLVARRYEFQHDDGTCYVNRSNWPDVHERVQSWNRSHSGRFLAPRYWVATLDGTWFVTLGELGPWAVQGQGGLNAPYDLSVLYGENDFHNPRG